MYFILSEDLKTVLYCTQRLKDCMLLYPKTEGLYFIVPKDLGVVHYCTQRLKDVLNETFLVNNCDDVEKKICFVL